MSCFEAIQSAALYAVVIAGINGPEVDDQQRPPLADDESFLDSLADLDRGLDVRASKVLDSSLSEFDHDLARPIEVPSTPLGSLAPRRRPWRTPIAARQRELSPFPPPPPVGERTRGPSIGEASPPTLPLKPPTQSFATNAPGSPGPTGGSNPDPTYESFYGFNEKPFGLSSDPKFVYRSASFDRATQDLIDAIDRHDGVMLLTGERGTGKTTLGLSLVGQIGGSSRTSFLTDPPATVDRLLDSLQQSAVIVVDDAHRWPVEMLEKVCGVGPDALGQRPQVVLIGEPVLLTWLRRRALRRLDRRVGTRCQLEPLTADEVARYVAHRLAVAGSGVRVEFDESAVAELHAISGGIPRAINLICDRALAEGHRRLTSRIDALTIASAADDLDLMAPAFGVRSIVQRAALLVAFVALVLVGAAAAAWVFRDDIQRTVIAGRR
jgi:type II secretory pathway predicted ATPase ExeA